ELGGDVAQLLHVLPTLLAIDREGVDQVVAVVHLLDDEAEELGDGEHRRLGDELVQEGEEALQRRLRGPGERRWYRRGVLHGGGVPALAVREPQGERTRSPGRSRALSLSKRECPHRRTSRRGPPRSRGAPPRPVSPRVDGAELSSYRAKRRRGRGAVAPCTPA